jgi:hypothetical protein
MSHSSGSGPESRKRLESCARISKRGLRNCSKNIVFLVNFSNFFAQVCLIYSETLAPNMQHSKKKRRAND